MEFGPENRSVLNVVLLAAGLLGAACGGESDVSGPSGSASSEADEPTVLVSTSQGALSASSPDGLVTLRSTATSTGTETVLTVDGHVITYTLDPGSGYALDVGDLEGVSLTPTEHADILAIHNALTDGVDEESVTKEMAGALAALTTVEMREPGMGLMSLSGELGGGQQKAIICWGFGETRNAYWDDSYRYATSSRKSVGQNVWISTSSSTWLYSSNRRFAAGVKYYNGANRFAIMQNVDNGTGSTYNKVIGTFGSSGSASIILYANGLTWANGTPAWTGVASQIYIREDGKLVLRNSSGSEVKTLIEKRVSDTEARNYYSGSELKNNSATIMIGEHWGNSPFTGSDYGCMGKCGAGCATATGPAGFWCLAHDVCGYVNASTNSTGSPSCKDEYSGATASVAEMALLCPFSYP